jgi:tripartite-type tricarboxylate transporter receptor subunit TctC
MAPAGTPDAIVDKIQIAVAKVAADPEVNAKLSKFGPLDSTQHTKGLKKPG